MKFRVFVLIVSFFISCFAFAEQDIQNLQVKVKIKTDVMIFGSLHLSSIKKELNKDELSSIIHMLETFAPTAVAVESLRPEDIITMLNGTEEYQPILSQFVGETFLSLAKIEQESLGITANGAIKKLIELLEASESSEFTRKRRIDVIRLAVAGYNKDTALLHWKYLNNTSSIDTITPKLQQYLNQLVSSNNEKNIIASDLAIKLNLNRLYPIDDHLDKDLYPNVVEQLMESYGKSKDVAAFTKSEYVSKPEKLKAQGLQTGNWLPLFSWINSDEYQSDVINKEWRLFVDKDLERKAGLARIALWEIRNLNMVSNIMRVAANHIGGKIIIVVGSSHKVFLEQYLENMIGINVVQFSDFISKEN